MYFDLIVFILFIFLIFLIILEKKNYVLNPLHSYPMEDNLNENFDIIASKENIFFMADIFYVKFKKI